MIVAQSHETSETHDRIGYVAGLFVDHQMIDFTDLFTLSVENIGSFNLFRRNQIMIGMCALHLSLLEAGRSSAMIRDHAHRRPIYSCVNGSDPAYTAPDRDCPAGDPCWDPCLAAACCDRDFPPAAACGADPPSVSDPAHVWALADYDWS